MLGKTHIEGGKSAFNVTAIICYFLSPFKTTNYMTNILAIILIYFLTYYSSTMKDLDHAESNIGNAPIFSYLVYGISHRMDKKHRSLFTHNIGIDIILWLTPALYIIFNHYTFKGTSKEIMYLIMCSLLAMFFGNLSHYILDMFTVAGVFTILGFLKLILYKLQRRDISSLRAKYRTNLINKKHSHMFVAHSPYIVKVPIEDYGKTGGEYENIFRENLRMLNCIAIHVVILLACGPSMLSVYNKILNIIQGGV